MVMPKWNSEVEVFELPTEPALTEDADLLGASHVDNGDLAESVRFVCSRPVNERKRLIIRFEGKTMYWREIAHLSQRPDFPAR